MTYPAVLTQWPGASFGCCDPADTQLAVGTSDVVEMVNQEVMVWTRSGTLRKDTSLGAFFSSSGVDRTADQMSDPRAVFDAASGRWFFSVLDVTQNQIMLYVTSTSDPLGTAEVYWFDSTGCPDQPRVGVSDSIVALTDNLFSDCGTFGQEIGGEVLLLDKATLLAGQPAQSTWYGPDPRYSSITPAVSLSSTGTLFLVATDYWGDQLDVFSATAVNSDSIPVSLVPVSGISVVPDALQSDPLLVASGDNRVQNAVFENGTLWLAFSDGCAVAGEPGTYSCARFDTVALGSMSLTADTEFALADQRDALYPNLMPTSDGNVIATFGYSSASETPGIGFIANPATPGSTWTQLTAGTGPTESGRWGDYFGIARDPNDPTHVWFAASYGTGGNGWGTTVAELGPYVAPVSSPPTITPSAPPASPPKAKPKPRRHAKPKKRHQK